MTIDRHVLSRGAALLLAASTCWPVLAQAAAASQAADTPLVEVDMTMVHALTVMAVIQGILIVSLAGIMRTLAGSEGWVKRFTRGGMRGLVLVPLLLFAAHPADAQAYLGDQKGPTLYQSFWWLVIINVLLFLILLVQLGLTRGLMRAVIGEAEPKEAVPVVAGPAWPERVWRRLTRQVPMAKEQDILLHHAYDGIQELDNVLPPWWVWLFYGTIAWSVVYLVGAHVVDAWPDQGTEYKNEMAQAGADIASYMATLRNTVDENTVTATTDPGVLASGRSLFAQNCTPCHGADAAGSENSVGPNLTDAYWLHGGGVNNIFRTIKYGVPEKGMMSWKAQLKPPEIAALASYILSLQGTGPATQKPPQGDPWKPAAASPDSAGTASDSLAAAMAVATR